MEQFLEGNTPSNRALISRKYSSKAPAKCKTYLDRELPSMMIRTKDDQPAHERLLHLVELLKNP